MMREAQNGDIAQLVEHLNGIQGVSGSNPLISIILDQYQDTQSLHRVSACWSTVWVAWSHLSGG